MIADNTIQMLHELQDAEMAARCDEDEPNAKAKEFYKLLDDAETPLYPAKWMTWHKDGRTLQENGEMRHPADSEAWTHFGRYGMWYSWDRTPQTDKEMLQHMTVMHKGWRGMLKSKHYKGKTFENVVASVLSGVDPSDWRTMCQKWNSREEQDIAERNRQNRTHQNMTYRRGRTSIYQLKDDFEKMTQMTTPSLQSDDVAPVLAEDAFVAVMG
ncbi:hypothetical protein Taro_003879 [Colocasia esculenta]|uniref:Uncharacterized protein n=1 Tax=Colocasia esculenta TaxID=4460 RepID=A0A843TNE2_COLES|nr:hypothetical protein [Colocasia esculenta]